MTPRIYVACLAAYNAGILHGEWINAAQEPEAIQAAINKILKDSPIPDAEDWAIHDSEDMGDISENPSISDIAKRAAFIEEHGEAAIAYLDSFYADDIDQFEDRYLGEFETVQEYAEQLIDDCGLLEKMPENLRHYFDYEKYSRDLEIELHTEQSNGKVYIFDPAV